jgi:hypothetical protein
MMDQQYDERARRVIRLLLKDADISESDIIRALEEQGVTALITTIRNVRFIARLVLEEQSKVHGQKGSTGAAGRPKP